MKMFLYTIMITFMFYNVSEAMYEAYTPELAYLDKSGNQERRKVNQVDVGVIQNMSGETFDRLMEFYQLLLSSNRHHVTPTRITSNSQFLQIGEVQAKGIKSIIFEGITIDEDFFRHYCQIMTGEYSIISFINCRTDGINFADVLDGSKVTDLTIKGCNIDTDDLSEVLLRINAYLIKKIDISNNNLGTASDLVREILISKICGRMCLDELILSGNSFSRKFIDDITTLCCNQK